MNTIYQLTLSWDDPLDDFATNDEELRWIAINHHRNFDVLEVRAEIDWDTGTVTATPIHDDIKATTYQILKTNRATHEDVQ